MLSLSLDQHEVFPDGIQKEKRAEKHNFEQELQPDLRLDFEHDKFEHVMLHDEHFLNNGPCFDHETRMSR